MNKLIIFEIKKIFKQKKYLIMLSSLVLITLLYAFQSKYLDELTKTQEINLEKFNVTSLEQSLNGMPDTSKDTEIYRNLSLELNLRQKKIKALEIDDWIETLHNDIDINKLMLSLNSRGLLSINETRDELQSKIDKNQYLLNNNIKPINEDFSLVSVNFLKNIIKILFPTILVFIISLMSIDIFSKEFDYGTIQILIYQSKSRSKIFISKLIALLILNISSILFYFIIFLLFSFIINGFGDLQYPIIVIRNSHYFIIPLGNFLLENFALILLSIIFLTTLSLMLSIFFSNTVSALTSNITILLILFLIEFTVKAPYLVKLLNPYTYFNTYNIVSGSNYQFYKDMTLSASNGALLLILYTILAIILSYRKFKTKDLIY